MAIRRAGAVDWDRGPVTAPTLPPADAVDPAPTRRRARAGRLASAVRKQRRPGPLPVWARGVLGALWAAGIGLSIALVPMLLVWMTTVDSGMGVGDALRYAGLLWVVAHGVPVAIGGVAYSLVPWGLAIIPLLLTASAGRWAARSSRAATVRDVALLTAVATVTYTALVALLAQVAGQSLVQPGSAALHGLVLGLLGFGFGVVRGSSLDLDALLPGWLLVSLKAGVVGALAAIGLGALAGATALLMRLDDAVTMAQSLEPGVWGGLALLMLGVAYVPVFVMWATAYVLGAGVVVGPAVVLSPFLAAGAPTQLPPFPLLAALPASTSPLSWALPIVGVLAGVAAGVLIGRRARAEARLTRLVMALGAAAVSGLLLSAGAQLASGSLGDLRLASVGPSATTVGVLAFVLITLGAVPSATAPAPPARPALAPVTPATPRSEPIPQEDPHE